MNLKKSFLIYCEKNKFEVNQNQLVIIDNLQNFYKENFKQSYLMRFFKKKIKNLVFI